MPPDSTIGDGNGGFVPWRDYADHKIVVRCCGRPPYGGSAKTCISEWASDSPFDVNVKAGDCYVGDAGVSTTTATATNWVDAQAICQADGGRLCSVDELRSSGDGGAGHASSRRLRSVLHSRRPLWTPPPRAALPSGLELA